MSQSSTRSFGTESITTIGWLAVALVVVTGAIHVYAGITEGRIPVALAGVGFFGALVLYVLNYRRRLLYIVGIVYTAVQIPLWYVVKSGEFTTIGYVDKAVQVLLILVLAYLYWQARSSDVDQQVSSRSGAV